MGHPQRVTSQLAGPAAPRGQGRRPRCEHNPSCHSPTATAACAVPHCIPSWCSERLVPMPGPLAGVNATATPASARRTRRDGWRACASTTRPAPTASAASPSTRTGPGLAAPPRPPTSVSVSGTGELRAGWRRGCTGEEEPAAFCTLLQPGRVDLHPRAPIHSITPRTLQHFFTPPVQPSAPSAVPCHGATL